MEFWGVEVKAGEPLHVAPKDGELIHISQVALGEVKNLKSANSIVVRMTVDENEMIIGTLSVEKAPQIMFDLVLEKDFTLSHGWKDGSLYFCGYTAAADQGDGEGPYGNDFSESDEESDESENEKIIEKEKPVAEVAVSAKSKSATKPGTSTKPKVTLVDPKEEDSDDSEGSDEDGDDESDDEDLDDDSDDDMSEDEETPKKVESSKKRPSNSEIKTPASTKKSKTETPQKTDGKKGAHTATPHPAKKSKSHSKAKHGGK
ncbi:histone deacetylase HDT1-like [Apium graveolens]|uniref:histone deacetylase HDT1-like n=1 Tax=Apium graveolens TaxID=4045 RepID=UPI003D7A1923